MIHVRLCLEALWMIWSLKSIGIINRLRLWVKTMNLYSCFIGFTDGAEQVRQLRSAMIAAVLSAIYDYETDWCLTNNPEDSLFRQLLDRHITNEEARKTALSLFLSDVNHEISSDGLERGAIALRFYHSIIGSQWLSEYSADEIGQYGRKLQIIDDLLDLETDQRDGCTNCFLTDGRLTYLHEAQQFMSSPFFAQLERRAPAYSLIKLRCQSMCNSLVFGKPSAKHFLVACRPLTMVYAAFAVVISFRFTDLTWLPMLLGTIAFASVTGNIMVFNDLVDRHHDTRKGKLLASRYTWLLGRFWVLLSLLLISLLIGTGFQSVWLALYIGAVWIVGLAYSAPSVRRWCILQPVVVAGCSAAPSLTGCVYHGVFSVSALLTAGIFASIIMMREIVKDIEDQHCDSSYKETLPVRLGHIHAVGILIALCYLPALLLALHPLWVVRLTGYGLAAVQFSNGLLLLNQKRVGLVKTSIDGLMAGIIAVILVVG